MITKKRRLLLFILSAVCVAGLLAFGVYRWFTQELSMGHGGSIKIRKGSQAFREMPAAIQEFPVIETVSKFEYSKVDTCTCGAPVPPSYHIRYFSIASEGELRSALDPYVERVRQGLPDKKHSFDLDIRPAPPDDTAHAGLLEVTANYMTGPQ